jgi:hypothetical protein
MTIGATVKQQPFGPPGAPAPRTPPRAPGSVRRSTVVDMVRPDGVTGDLRLVGAGRDVATSRDQRLELLGGAALGLTVDYVGASTVTSISAEPAPPDLQRLVGTSARAGFRRAVGDAAPDERRRRTLLHQLLDDVPVTTLISGYAVNALREPEVLRSSGVQHVVDLCAGFQAGGTMMDWVERTGSVPTRYGPQAPPIETVDPEAWPAVTGLPATAMRRRRLLDVAPGDEGRVRVRSWFRDEYQNPGGASTIVHEYDVAVLVEPDDWVVLEIVATPRVLPWDECPQAALSATRLVGTRLTDVREDVRSEFVGISTCTHLNDQLRALGDVVGLWPRREFLP